MRPCRPRTRTSMIFMFRRPCQVRMCSHRRARHHTRQGMDFLCPVRSVLDEVVQAYVG